MKLFFKTKEVFLKIIKIPRVYCNPCQACNGKKSVKINHTQELRLIHCYQDDVALIYEFVVYWIFVLLSK